MVDQSRSTGGENIWEPRLSSVCASRLSRRHQKTMLIKKISMGALTIFLVENHEDTVRYLQLFLEQFGYKVSVAADMTTALREIPKSRCDVLISDIGLPDGDGWQLMEELGEN